MRRSRKIILAVLLSAVVLAGSIGGIVMASDGEEEEPPAAHHGFMLDRVCEIYNEANPDSPIDSEALEEAFSQAMEERRAEMEERMTEAREAFRQRLLEEGKITEEQLEEFDGRFPPRFGRHGGMFPHFGERPCEPETAE